MANKEDDRDNLVQKHVEPRPDKEIVVDLLNEVNQFRMFVNQREDLDGEGMKELIKEGEKMLERWKDDK